MKSRVATFYAIGERIWYRQVAHTNQVAGVVEDITVGSPTVSYSIRLENKDRVWADFSQLLPCYRYQEKFMTTESEVSPAMWWRGKVVELREVAGRTADPELRRRLFDVADRWEESADHLGRHAATLVA